MSRRVFHGVILLSKSVCLSEIFDDYSKQQFRYDSQGKSLALFAYLCTGRIEKHKKTSGIIPRLLAAADGYGIRLARLTN
jgi:hypothetical protein